MPDHIITAKCIDKCMDSMNVVQYFPNDMCEFNISTGKVNRFDGVYSFDRQLFTLKSLGGKWVFQFDRANASNTGLRLFFCKECGQPFNKLSELGTHSRSTDHNKDAAHVAKTKRENADEEEERLVAERLKAEAATQELDTIPDNEQNTMLKDAILAQQGDKEMGIR